MYSYICASCDNEYKTSFWNLAHNKDTICLKCTRAKKRKGTGKQKTDLEGEETPPKRKSKKGFIVYKTVNGRKVTNYVQNEYYQKVWTLTEQQPLNELPGYERRGFRRLHLDHIVPISFGMKNNIPPELIASLNNLRFISFRKNLNKRDTLTEDSINLLKEWGYDDLNTPPK